MSKRLKTTIQACRALLVNEVARQLALENISATPRIQDAAFAVFLEFAVLSCLEAQPGLISPRLTAIAVEADVFAKLRLVREMLSAELCFPLPDAPLAGRTLATATVQTLRQVLREEISPAAWQTDDILGWLYQYFYADTPEQRQQGRFYTPAPIAEAIVAQVFEAFGERQRDLRDCTLLDLGCGSGVFALRAFERLYQVYAHEGRRLAGGPGRSIAQQILEKHLFLVDNDPRACQIAAINLYLKAKRAEPSGQFKRLNIVCADALRRWETETDTAQKSCLAQTYDLIVGNPPYLVVNQAQTPIDVLRHYKSYRSAAFKLNTFALFIERGLDLLKPHGILGMIVPNTLLTQVYFEPLRQYLLATGKILRIIDTKRMFANASVENCILLVQREAAASARPHHLIECVTNISNRRGLNPDSALSRIPQDYFDRAPFHIFHVHLDAQVLALLEKIAGRHPKLGDICESHDGVNPGNAKAKLIVAEKLDETCQKVLHGKNIGRYWLHWGGLYVRYNRSVLTKGDNVRWGHRAALDAAKILTRQTADRIIGTFDEGEYYVTNSIHTTVLKTEGNGFQLKYLLGLFNSKLLSFYYRKLFPEEGQLFSQVKLVNLRQLPLKQGTPQEQQQVIAGVENLLQAGQIAFTSSEKRRQALQDLDARLDRVIYGLYQLTADEIRVVEQAMGKKRRSLHVTKSGRAG